MSLEWILLGFRILAAIILYTFLGVAFYLIWRDLRRAAAQTENQPEVVHQLRVVASVGNGTLTVGEALSLEPVTWLGRDPDNTIVIEDSSASARHARLCQQNGLWWLEDLGSQAGTMLNDTPVSRPTLLSNGDVIGIGKSRLRLETISE